MRLLTLLDYPNATLLDLPRLLTEPSFRGKVLSHLTDPHVRAFWMNEFDKYTPWLRSEAVSPILNKMGQFLTSLPLRNIVGQTESAFKMRSVMDEGKILLVNLSKGKIGEDNGALLRIASRDDDLSCSVKPHLYTGRQAEIFLSLRR